ncbi:hypothetical protein R84981_001695 [Carnimonas sp. R-84981]|uniref:tail fiber protein n=1 Tax=Carnimonas bestiolae TaxID=3402172 RepID=UPI003EDB910D
MERISAFTDLVSSNGSFREGSLVGGIPPTPLRAPWLNLIQDECLNLAAASGESASADDATQMLRAVKKLISDAVQSVSDAVTESSAQSVGMIAAFACSTAPDGWTAGDGGLLKRSDYKSLWAFVQKSGNLASSEESKLSGQWGPGDGKTTFSKPDLRGEFLRGVDAGRGVDKDRRLGSVQDSANKTHNHGGSTEEGGGYTPSGKALAAGGHVHKYDRVKWYRVSDGGGFDDGYKKTFEYEEAETDEAPPHEHELQINAVPPHAHVIANSGGPEARPRNVSVLYCIKL